MLNFWLGIFMGSVVECLFDQLLGDLRNEQPQVEAFKRQVVRGSKHCGSWRRELRVVRLLLRKPHRNVLDRPGFPFVSSPPCGVSGFPSLWNLKSGSSNAMETVFLVLVLSKQNELESP